MPTLTLETGLHLENPGQLQITYWGGGMRTTKGITAIVLAVCLGCIPAMALAEATELPKAAFGDPEKSVLAKDAPADPSKILRENGKLQPYLKASEIAEESLDRLMTKGLSARALGQGDDAVPFAPGNDNFAAATQLSGATGRMTGTNTAATREVGEPAHCSTSGLVSVWYSWVATGNGTATFDTIGSTFDAVLSVYTGATVSSLTRIACNDDAVGLQSRVSFTASAGTSYYVAVSGFGGATGNIVLNWAGQAGGLPAPRNDNFSAADTLSGASGSTTGTNIGSTRESGEPLHCSTSGLASVWYVWTSTGTGTAAFHTAFSGFDTVLSVYTGSSVSSLTRVTCNDDISSSLQSSVSFSASIGTIYYIAVNGYSGATGSIVLTWSGPSGGSVGPANDNFASASSLSGASGRTTGSNASSSRESGEPLHCATSGLASVWYQWTAPASGATTFDTIGSSFDTVLSVYTGGSVGGLTRVNCNDDASGLQSRTAFTASTGTTYRIAVSGYAGATGNITLNWSLVVSTGAQNDNFASATTLSGSTGSTTGSNAGATRETSEPQHCGTSGLASVWYVWSPSSSGSATFDTIGSTFDTVLSVYTGSALTSLSAVSCNDDAVSLQSRTTFSVTAGRSYYVAVNGYSGLTGSIRLNWSTVTSTVSNDTFAAAILMSGDQGQTTGSNVGATRETGEPLHCNTSGLSSVWYRWTPSQSGAATIDTINSTFDTVLSIYTGSSVSALTEVNCDDDASGVQSRVVFNATAGTAYYIAISGYGSASGAITLSWRLSPQVLTYAPQNGWWWNPNAPGWGFSLEVNSNNSIFSGQFTYKADGSPIWYVGSGVFENGRVSLPFHEYEGGRPLSGSWRPASQRRQAGVLSVSFLSDSRATATWTSSSPDVISGSTSIERFRFGSADAASSQVDRDESELTRNLVHSSKSVPALFDPKPPVEARHLALRAAARDAGNVRVIARLKVPFKPEGELSSSVQVEAQRSAIRSQHALVSAMMEVRGAKVLFASKITPVLVLDAPPQALEALLEHPLVDAVHEDVAQPFASQDYARPLLRQSVGQIHAEQLWAAGVRGRGAAVAILDTGVEANHPFLAGRVVAEACFSTGDTSRSVASYCPSGASSETGTGTGRPCSNTADGCYHGTHVAGIVAGSATSISGVAPEASIVAVQVFSQFNSAASCSRGRAPCVLAQSSDIIRALEYVHSIASTHNIVAVNMSLGGGGSTTYCDSDPRKSIIDSLRSIGVATIIATGNDGFTDRVSSPSCISSAIRVGAVNRSDNLASFSNAWALPMLVAPGTNIEASLPGGIFGTLSGTSMATPHVAGAWALLKGVLPSASIDQLSEALRTSGFPVPGPSTTGSFPRINVEAAYLDRTRPAETGWWWNQSEPGWGAYFETQGSSLFGAFYMYRSGGDPIRPNGDPVWYVTSGQMVGSTYSGSLQEYSDGQTFGGAWRQARVTAVHGTVTVQFSSQVRATLVLPNGQQVSLTRFVF